MIAFCGDCDVAIHPPQLVCPVCLSHQIASRAVVGTGTIYTFTINHQPWFPDMKVPFAIAVVDIDGAPGVRVTAPVACYDPSTVQIGQRVTIGFEQSGDVWLPVWHEASGAKQ